MRISKAVISHLLEVVFNRLTHSVVPTQPDADSQVVEDGKRNWKYSKTKYLLQLEVLNSESEWYIRKRTKTNPIK